MIYVAYAALFFMVLTILWLLLSFFKLIYKRTTISYKRQTTYNINLFFEAALILDFSSVTSALDLVTPYNVFSLPYWSILGEYKGKTFNNKIMYAAMKISLVDFNRMIIKLAASGLVSEWNFTVKLFFTFFCIIV